MDPNHPANTSSREPLEILRKQIGDLHLSLRLSESKLDDPLHQEFVGLQALIDHAVFGIYRSSIEGQFVTANQAIAQFFGYASSQDMIQKVTNIGTQLYVELHRRNEWEQLFHYQEMVGPVVWQGRRVNHETIWLEEYARVIRDSQGQHVGYEGVLLDVTARYSQSTLPEAVGKQINVVKKKGASPDARKTKDQLCRELAEAQRQIVTLREQLDRFQVAAMGSQEGLWECRPLPGEPWESLQTPTWYSAQFKALLGFEEHEFPPVSGSWAARIHPDDVSHVFQAIRNHIENQVPYDVESRLKTKQGEFRWFKGKGQAVYDEQGSFVRGGGTIRDITEQKESEQAVKREHALLTTVVEGTSDIIFVKDHEGRYLLVNSMGAAILECSIHEIIGRTDAEIFPNGDHVLFTQHDEDVIRCKAPQSFEVDVEDAGAVLHTFLVTKEIFVQAEEGLEGLFCIARDITFRKATELTIREREKRYRAIMENAYDLIIEVDEVGTFLYASPNFNEVLGYSPQSLLGANIFSFVHSDDYDIVVKEFERMLVAGNARAIYRYRHQNGTYRWFESTGRIFHATFGDIRGVIVTRDITDRKKSEEALEAIVQGTVAPGSPNFFKNLVHQLAETLEVPMVFLAERDEERFPIVRGVAFWHSDHFVEAFEYNCLEGPCEKVFEGHPVHFSQRVQAQFPKNPTVKTLNIESYSGMPLFNSEGKIVGSLAIMDLKPLSLNAQEQSLLQVFAARAGGELERKRAQDALRDSEERYRALYDEAPLMFFTVDVDLRILSVNQFGAKVLGYEREVLVGQSVKIVVDPEDQERFCQEIEECLLSMNQASQKIFRKVKKDGTRLWVRETARSIVGPNHEPMVLLSCEDISEQKRVEMALAQSEKQLRHTQKMEAIGTLAGGIAHDFNNILGAILGYSELALTQAKKDSKLTSYIGEVLTAGHRAKELVKQILAFSRQSDQEREAVDLNRMVEEALKMVRATLPATIEIRSTLARDSAVVFADATQIHQVIMNLCANAEFFMRKTGGELILNVRSIDVTEGSNQAFSDLKPGPYMQLTIQDSGQGIAPQVLERIFEPFFTTKGLGEGTGLGLAVVHGIVVGHGGHISASSEEGVGTTFTVLLPRLDVVLPAQISNAMEWSQGRGKILFIDDEDILVRWGEQVLTHLGYTVVTKTNPHEAVALFRKHPYQFDVVVTDQTMPTMNGEALAKALLEIRHDIPIVLCTGFSHTMSQEKANQLGLKGFLMKPVNGAVLARTLQDVLENHG